VTRRRGESWDDRGACAARRGGSAGVPWPKSSALMRWCSIQTCSQRSSSSAAPRRHSAWWCLVESPSCAWRRRHRPTRPPRRQARSRRAASVAASRSSHRSLAHRADRRRSSVSARKMRPGEPNGSPGSARSWIADLLLRPRDLCRAWAGLTLPTTETGQQPRPLRCPVQRSRRSGRVGDPPDVQPSAPRCAAVQPAAQR